MPTNGEPFGVENTGRLRFAAGVREEEGAWALFALLTKRIGILKVLGALVIGIVLATAAAVATASSVVTATKLDKQFHEHSTLIDAHPRLYRDVESLKVSRTAQRTDTKWIMKAVDRDLRSHGVSHDELEAPPEHPEELLDDPSAP